MEQNGVVSFRHRRSPSSDRFLGVFSPPKAETAIAAGDASVANDELNEHDIFWTGDFTEPNHRSVSSPFTDGGNQNHHRQSFKQQERFGILAALSEDNRKFSHAIINRKHSIASSPSSSSSSSTATLSSKHPVSSSPLIPFQRAMPVIPKPPVDREYSQSVPARKFQQSAPVNVPMMPARKVRNSELADVDIGDEEEDEMLPPHEIVARGSARSPKTTFSVLEGVGRTLKGRDLRRVRNAVWRQTGFLD